MPGAAHASGVTFRPPQENERARLLAWLDDGLREGRRGRLEAEYRVTIDRAQAQQHVVAWLGERPVAHALLSCVDARAAGSWTRIGLIGSVFSDPACRGRGLARGCVERAVALLEERAASIALLWTDLDDFYAPLGFQRTGFEWIDWIDRGCVERAICAQTIAGRAAIEVGCPRATDWPTLEALHDARPSRCRRAAGSLRLHASAPDCEIVVARQNDRIVAYAACGRGDDFADIVHDWAGSSLGVLACALRHLSGRSAIDRIGVLSAGACDDPIAALRAAGSQPCAGDLGLARVLDAQALWSAATASDPALLPTRACVQGEAVALYTSAGRTDLSHEDFLCLVLGRRGRKPPEVAASPREQRALARRLPWRLFLWGFDSI